MMIISDNLYDVALTAIRNCTWKGTEIEKVQRALEELERVFKPAAPTVAAPDVEEEIA